MKRWEGPARERLSSLACAILVVIGCASIAAQAQEAPAAGAAAEQPAIAGEQPTTDKVPAETDLLAPEQLDILVAPVALYPDPLLVLILQGSTFPVDVVAAHRFLGKLPEQPELQPDSDWDSSIVGLLNYPDVVARMDEELDWTEALGESVLNQLEDVQGSIQQVRLQAYMAGMLVTDEHQVVTGSPDLIIVLPADERQIFVPSYDPAAVLAAEPVPLPPVEAAAEPPPEVSAEPAPDEAESVEAVAEAPVEPAPETSVEPGSAPATYQGPQPLPPVYASAPPVVQYSDPSPSFWTGAATFAGGAAIGGLLGYVIGDDDDNDWDWNNDEDWDDIADDVDDIAGDVDELTEGFEDFRVTRAIGWTSWPRSASSGSTRQASASTRRRATVRSAARRRPINSSSDARSGPTRWRNGAMNGPTSVKQQPRTARRRRTSYAPSIKNTKPSRCRTSSASARVCPRPAAIGRRVSGSPRWATAAGQWRGSRRRR
jgi:hypothetical protein